MKKRKNPIDDATTQIKAQRALIQGLRSQIAEADVVISQQRREINELVAECEAFKALDPFADCPVCDEGQLFKRLTMLGIIEDLSSNHD